MRMTEYPMTWITHPLKESLEAAKRAGVRLYGPKIVAVPGELSAGEYRHLVYALGQFFAHCDASMAPSVHSASVSAVLMSVDFIFKCAEADGLLGVGLRPPAGSS